MRIAVHGRDRNLEVQIIDAEIISRRGGGRYMRVSISGRTNRIPHRLAVSIPTASTTTERTNNGRGRQRLIGESGTSFALLASSSTFPLGWIGRAFIDPLGTIVRVPLGRWGCEFRKRVLQVELIKAPDSYQTQPVHHDNRRAKFSSPERSGWLVPTTSPGSVFPPCHRYRLVRLHPAERKLGSAATFAIEALLKRHDLQGQGNP